MKAVLFFLFLFIFPKNTLAVCPLCTVAVGTGLGFSRVLGIDDVITGIWMGGLIVSSALWFSSWLEKKNYKIPYRDLSSLLLFFLVVILPLYWGKIIGISGNTFLGIDKFLFGMLFGLLIFLLSVRLDVLLREKNNGKVLFYYQKVVLPLFLLSLASFVLFIILS